MNLHSEQQEQVVENENNIFLWEYSQKSNIQKVKEVVIRCLYIFQIDEVDVDDVLLLKEIEKIEVNLLAVLFQTIPTNLHLYIQNWARVKVVASISFRRISTRYILKNYTTYHYTRINVM